MENDFLDYKKELYHYGVKGQKWGVRKVEDLDEEDRKVYDDLDEREKKHYLTLPDSYRKQFNRGVAQPISTLDSEDLKVYNSLKDKDSKYTYRCLSPEFRKEFNKLPSEGDLQSLGARTTENPDIKKPKMSLTKINAEIENLNMKDQEYQNVILAESRMKQGRQNTKAVLLSIGAISFVALAIALGIKHTKDGIDADALAAFKRAQAAGK